MQECQKNVREGDWTNHLSVTIDHRLTSTNKIKEAVLAKQVVKSNFYIHSSLNEEMLSCSDKTPR